MITKFCSSKVLSPVFFTFSHMAHLFSSQVEQTLLEHRKPERHEHLAFVVSAHFSSYSVHTHKFKPQNFQMLTVMLNVLSFRSLLEHYLQVCFFNQTFYYFQSYPVGMTGISYICQMYWIYLNSIPPHKGYRQFSGLWSRSPSNIHLQIKKQMESIIQTIQHMYIKNISSILKVNKLIKCFTWATHVTTFSIGQSPLITTVSGISNSPNIQNYSQEKLQRNHYAQCAVVAFRVLS